MSNFNPTLSPVSNWSDFEPITTEQWQEQVFKDLKGKRTADELRTQPFVQYPEIRLEATYLSDQPLPALSAQIGSVMANKQPGWAYREMLCVDKGAEQQVVEQAKQCLEWGADQIAIWGLAGPDYQKLLGLFGQAGIKNIRLYIEAGYGVIEAVASNPYWANMGGTLVWIPAMTPTYVGETGYLKSLATLLADYEHVSILADVSGYAEAGASLVSQQALAYSILTEWLHRLSDNSIEPRQLAHRLEVHVGMGPDYLQELAGLRALRYGLDQIWKRFGVQSPDVRIWARASQAWFTPNDPDMNLLRATTISLAAAQGGADVLSVPQHNAGLKNRSSQQIDDAMRWARNISHLLKSESYAGLVNDPAAGSRYIEHASSQIANAAWGQFQRWEQLGGYLSCYKNQRIHEHVTAEAKTVISELASGQRIMVGGNKYNIGQNHELAAFGQPVPGLDAANFGLIRVSEMAG